MKRAIIIVGGSASGKSELVKELKAGGAVQMLMETLRPARPGEKDGEEYFFVKGFSSPKESALLHIDAGGHFQYRMDPSVLGAGEVGVVAIINSNFAVELTANLLKAGVDVLPVFMDIPRSVRAERLRKRGSSDEEVVHRLNREDPDYGKAAVAAFIEEVMHKTINRQNGALMYIPEIISDPLFDAEKKARDLLGESLSSAA